MSLQKLRNKVVELFELGKFKEITELLTDEVLDQYKDAELYAMLARAVYRLYEDDDKVFNLAQKAIGADQNHYLGYVARGIAWYSKGEYDKALADYDKAIELKPDEAYAYNSRGNAWYLKSEYDKALADYDKAIELKPDFSDAYNNRGVAWDSEAEYDKALSDYAKAIELKPDYAAAYNNRGVTWDAKAEYDKALADYDKAIELKNDYADAYYNRGYSRRKSGKDLEQSVKDYEEYLKLAGQRDDVWAKRAKDIIEELKEKIKDNELKDIIAIISEIKKLLLISEGCITHYTGLAVAKKLIWDKSKFRISEGAFLNDTSEGTELFTFLKYSFFKTENGLVAKKFAPKPFIGSFVSENKHDDLNMWRFYGKDNGVEAKGCALTLRMKEFVDAINQSVTSGTAKPGEISLNDISFYRVAYLDHNARMIFQIPNSSTGTEEALNEQMGKLKEKVKGYRAKDRSVLEKHLNSIAFLFKSDAYKNENEIRLVIKGVEFEKKFDVEANPPRVYIELINIGQLVEKITLGPKVEKADEWAAAFNYSLNKDEDKKPVEILISRLPYK